MFAKVAKRLGKDWPRKEKERIRFADFLLLYHEKELFIFPEAYKKGCTIEMNEAEVLLVVVGLLLHALQLEECEKVVSFLKLFSTLYLAIKRRRAGILDEIAVVHATFDIRHSSIKEGNAVLEHESPGIVQHA